MAPSDDRPAAPLLLRPRLPRAPHHQAAAGGAGPSAVKRRRAVRGGAGSAGVGDMICTCTWLYDAIWLYGSGSSGYRAVFLIYGYLREYGVFDL